jgi:hypothetical protein
LFRNKFAAAPAFAEVQPALIVVVTSATELDPVDRAFATQRVRIDVVELHGPSGVAAMAARSHEGTAAEIPHPDHSLDRGGYCP